MPSQGYSKCREVDFPHNSPFVWLCLPALHSWDAVAHRQLPQPLRCGLPWGQRLGPGCAVPHAARAVPLVVRAVPPAVRAVPHAVSQTGKFVPHGRESLLWPRVAPLRAALPAWLEYPPTYGSRAMKSGSRNRNKNKCP